MAKSCLHCKSLVFSKNLCKYHWAREYQKPLKRTRIRQISSNKKTLDEEYKGICRELDTEAKAGKWWLCFFCGKPLGVSCDHHHVAGKTGLSDDNIPLYLDKNGIILSHRTCHRRYHDITIAELLKAPYYEALMKKIQYICKAKYHNMKLKHERFLNK